MTALVLSQSLLNIAFFLCLPRVVIHYCLFYWRYVQTVRSLFVLETHVRLPVSRDWGCFRVFTQLGWKTYALELATERASRVSILVSVVWLSVLTENFRWAARVFSYQILSVLSLLFIHRTATTVILTSLIYKTSSLSLAGKHILHNIIAAEKSTDLSSAAGNTKSWSYLLIRSFRTIMLSTTHLFMHLHDHLNRLL
jgi:hypothetical protein